MTSFALDADGELAVDPHRLCLAGPLRQRLGGQHVLDLAGADAEGQRTEGPCVEVWLSPHTMVMPGWVRPSCGPLTCTMPWSRVPMGACRMPNSSVFFRSASTCARLTGSAMGASRSVVGTLWSSVRHGNVGTADGAPGRAEPVEGLRAVTSCTRCRSMLEQVRSPSERRTTCCS